MTSALRVALVAHWAALSLACSEDRLTALQLSFEHPDRLDFGVVPVGTARTLPLVLRNNGEIPVRVDRVRSEAPPFARFQIRPESVAVAPQLEVPLQVRFAPDAPTGPLSFDLFLVTAELGELPVAVTAEGVREGLAAEPRALDFGRVLRGFTSTRQLELRSLSFEDITLVLAIEPAEHFATAPVTLRPGDRVSVRFRYAPASEGPPGRDDAVAVFSTCPEPRCRVEVPLTGMAITEPVECEPDPVDFGAVAPGALSAAVVRCRNISENEVELPSSEVTEGADSGFSEIEFEASVLHPGASKDVLLRFFPPRGAEPGPARGTWTLRVSETDSGVRLRPVRVALHGHAGGPVLRVRPPGVDFGRAALGITARATVEIANIGDQLLTVRDFETDGPFFVEASGVLAVGPRATENLVLAFSSTAAGEARGALRFRSDDPERPAVQVELRGRALELSECELGFLSGPADFGSVAAFRATVVGVAVQNQGMEPCLLREPRVTGTGYDLARGDEERLLLPGEVAVYVLRFAPKDLLDDPGEFEILTSRRRDPRRRLSASGRGALDVPLMDPDAIDFGEVSAGCAARQTVRVHNTTEEAITLRDVRLEATGPGFGFERPPPDLRIEPHDFGEVPVFYEPREGDTEPEVGRMSLDFGDAPAGHVTLLARPVERARVEERFRQGGRSEVDLLFVIDSSGSMRPYQEAVRAGLPELLETARHWGVDLRIAVVNMDGDGACRRVWEVPRQGARQGDCGFFSEGDEQRRAPAWRVLSSGTVPSLETAFGHTSNLGTDGSRFARGFGAAELALEPRRLLGHNRGLLERDHPLFSILFVSDKREQSAREVRRYQALFASIVGQFDRDRHAVSGLLPEACPDDARPWVGRYAAAVCATSGVIGQFDDTGQGIIGGMGRVARAVLGQRERFMLRRPVFSGSIEIEVDGVPVPSTTLGRTRWTYLQTSNAVAFEPNSVPAYGSEVVIRYRPRCERRRT